MFWDFLYFSDFSDISFFSDSFLEDTLFDFEAEATRLGNDKVQKFAFEIGEWLEVVSRLNNYIKNIYIYIYIK